MNLLVCLSISADVTYVSVSLAITFVRTTILFEVDEEKATVC